MKLMKSLLTILICGGTLAASIGIMIWLAEFTGWYIFAYGLVIAIIRLEFVMIWDRGPVRTLVVERKKRTRRGRRG